MGNKTSGIEKVPITERSGSFKDPSNVCFGIKNMYKPNAIVAVLDSLYNIPCLCEFICHADIDVKCKVPDKLALGELRKIFEMRCQSQPNTVISVDQFILALTNSRLEGETNDFDCDDPSQVYDAIASLIITTLPELSLVFLRDKSIKELLPSGKEAAGICISIQSHSTNNIRSIVSDKFFSKIKRNFQPSPVFVITTSYSCDSSQASLIFPPILNFRTSNNHGFIYSLQSVIVEDVIHAEVKPFYLIGNKLNWYEGGFPLKSTTMDFVLSLGSEHSRYRVKVLIYIQVMGKENKKCGNGSNGCAITEKKKDTSTSDTSNVTDSSESREKHGSIKTNKKIISENHDRDVRVDKTMEGVYDNDAHDVDVEDEDENEDEEDDEDDDYDYIDDDDDDEDDEEYDDGFDNIQYYADEVESEDGVMEESNKLLFPETNESSNDLQEEKDYVMDVEIPEKVIRRKSNMSLGTKHAIFKSSEIQRLDDKVGADGKHIQKVAYIQSINAMDGFTLKSPEELRYEDYCLDMIASCQAKASSMTNSRSPFRQSEECFLSGLLEYNSAELGSKHVESLFYKALKLNPQGPHAYLCNYYIAMENFPVDLLRSEQFCKDALSINPSFGEGILLYCAILIELERSPKEIMELLDKIRQSNPELYDSSVVKAYERIKIRRAEEYKNKGNDFLSKGKFDLAIQSYSDAISTVPDGEKSHIYYCNRAAAKCELVRSVSDNLSLTTTSNSSNSSGFPISSAEECIELINSAVTDCETSLTLEPSYTKASFRILFCQGFLCYFREEYDESLRLYEKALSLDHANISLQHEIKKAQTAKRVIEARQKALEIERELKAKEIEKAEMKEREKRIQAEKKAREEEIKKEKEAQKLQEKIERQRIKQEKEQLRLEKEKAAAEEKRLEKERLRQEKERERQIKEQERLEEREKRRIEKETEKLKSKLEKERQEKLIAEKKETQSMIPSSQQEASLETSGVEVPSVNVPRNVVAAKAKSKPSLGSIAAITKSLGCAPKLETPSLSRSTSLESTESTPTSAEFLGSSKNPPKSQSPTPLLHSSSASNSASNVASSAIITRFMDCPQSKVGPVIGSKGVIINEMMKRSGCKMSVNQDFPDGHPRKVVMTGTSKQIEDAKFLVSVVISYGPNAIYDQALLDEVMENSKTVECNDVQSSPPVSSQSWGVSRKSMKSCLWCLPGSGYSEDDRLFAIGSCNHCDICSICSMRRRMIDGDSSCPTCGLLQTQVVCCAEKKNFNDFGSLIFPSIDFEFDSTFNMYFPKDYYHSIVQHLWDFRCRSCSLVFSDWNELRQHYGNYHGFLVCQICSSTKKFFPLDIPLFSNENDLNSHMIYQRSDGNELHPQCTVCKDRFFDKQQLSNHVSAEHISCSLCSSSKYFKDSKALSDHYSRDHFACNDPSCQGKVAFRSLFDLQAHKKLHKADENVGQSLDSVSLTPSSNQVDPRSFSTSNFSPLPNLISSRPDSPSTVGSEGLNYFPPLSEYENLSKDLVNDYSGSQFSGGFDLGRLLDSVVSESKLARSTSGGMGALDHRSLDHRSLDHRSPSLTSFLAPESSLSNFSGLGNAGLSSIVSDVDYPYHPYGLDFESSNDANNISSIELLLQDGISSVDKLRPLSPSSSLLMVSSSHFSMLSENVNFSLSGILGGNEKNNDPVASERSFFEADFDDLMSYVSPNSKFLDLEDDDPIHSICEEPREYSYFNSLGSPGKDNNNVNSLFRNDFMDLMGKDYENSAHDNYIGSSQSLQEESESSVIGVVDLDLRRYLNSNSLPPEFIPSSMSMDISYGIQSNGSGGVMEEKLLTSSTSSSSLSSSSSSPSFSTTTTVVPTTSNAMGSLLSSSSSAAVVGMSSFEDRSQLNKETMDRMIEILRQHPEGVLGSQFPDIYYKFFQEKLSLETSRGRRLKLLNVLDGHPCVRKEKSGTWRWFFHDRQGFSASAAALGAEAQALGTIIDVMNHPWLSVLKDVVSGFFYCRMAGNTESTPLCVGFRLLPDILTALSSEDITPTLSDISTKFQCSVAFVEVSIVDDLETCLVYDYFGKVFNPDVIGAIADMLRQLSPDSSFPESEDDIDSISPRSFVNNNSNNNNGSGSGNTSPYNLGGRIQKIFDIPQNAVGLIAGKLGKKLFAMRKKSGAYMNLVSKCKSKAPAKLTISGLPENVNLAISLVQAALADTGNSLV